MTTTFADLPVDGTIDLTDTTRYMISADGATYDMTPKYLAAYRASTDEQLNKWVAGESVHNVLHDECCPDFSCCSKNSWTLEMRQHFKNATEVDRRRMLLVGLQSALVQSGTSVYVAGESEPVAFH